MKQMAKFAKALVCAYLSNYYKRFLLRFVDTGTLIVSYVISYLFYLELFTMWDLSYALLTYALVYL